MSKAVKAAGLGLVIFATVWVVTLWQWYSTQRSVTGQQVAMQLVVLPAALTAIALVAWLGATRLRSFAARPIEPPPPPSAPVQEGLANSAAAPRGPSGALATVVSEAVALSAGHDAITAWNGLRTGQVRPSLDSAVQDTEGLPVFTARLSDLDTADWLDAHAELSDGDLPALPESVVRSLALLEGPLHELLDALQGLQPPAEQRVAGPATVATASSASVSTASVSAAHLSGVGVTLSESDRSRAEQRVPVLSVHLCLPPTWSEPDRQRALGWVRQRCGAMVDWMQAWVAREPQWQLESPATPELLWEGLTQSLRRVHADPRPHLHLVLAADSLVDEDSVMRLLGRGELFTHQHQGGRVPGEAAVGLLLANPAWQAQFPIPDAPGLGWPVSARREQSADRIGRVGSELVGALLRQALDSAAPSSAESPDTCWVVSDADHRASRCVELFEAVQSVQPGIDPLSSVIRAGDACGDMGLARALVPVALASSAVRQGLSPDDGNARPTPALVGLLQCSHSRVVIPVWPPTAVPVFPSV